MKVDQYESVFRAAERTPFVFDSIVIERPLVVTAMSGSEAEEFALAAESFLDAMPGNEDRARRWRRLGHGDYRGLDGLLQAVRAKDPDLIVTYRSLESESFRWPYTLGEHLDVITQIVECPVLVVPHPKSGRASEHALQDLNVVMAMTDHMVGDSRLVNYAAAFTEPNGALLLAHVEDDATFERYLGTIAKIPAIDTEMAGEQILGRLLGEARDFIASCRDELGRQTKPLRVEEVVTTGHRITEIRRLIDEHEVDLLVMHTKDEDQLAMHGLAYPLAVGLRHIPLLLL